MQLNPSLHQPQLLARQVAGEYFAVLNTNGRLEFGVPLRLAGHFYSTDESYSYGKSYKRFPCLARNYQ
jgi:hypothetical protein